MPARSFTVCAVQMRMTAKREENLASAEAAIREAARHPAQVICLPELFATPYFCQTEDHAQFGLAEPIPGPTTERLSRLAAEHGLVIVGSVFERRAPGVYHNSAAIIDADGRIAGVYRKMHIPDDPLYYEKFYFSPGDLGFRSFDTRAGRLGALVCWDQWFPEGARLTALRGAEVLIYPTAIGWHPAEKARYGAAQADAWRTIQRAHAIANGVYVVAANRVGHEGAQGGGIEFWGGSFICDPFGSVLAEAGRDGSELLYAEVDPGHLEAVRQHWPFLRDRRVDAYAAMTERFLDRS